MITCWGAVTASGFEVSTGKSSGLARRAKLFNYSLGHGRTAVLEAHRIAFYAEDRTDSRRTAGE